MSYEPRKYWPARYERHGALTVGRMGMREAEVDAQGGAFWDHIQPRIPRRRCRRLLDFGAGAGRLAGLLSNYAGKYVGCDISAEAIELAWEENVYLLADGFRPGFVHMPDDRIPFPDSHFDCVVACTVLQHIVDDAQFALWTREIDRVTCPGGTVVVLDGVGCKAAHCRSRTPGEVGLALGMAIEGEIGIVDAESKRSHWCAAFRKGPSVLVGALQEILRAPVVPVGLPGGEFVR